MMQPECDISVIVPCRNEAEHIAETVARLRNQRGAGEAFTYEVFFVDGQSEDQTLRILREQLSSWPDAHVLVNERRITPVAFNMGIAQARGRYVAILGAHAEIAEDYLLSCLKTIRRRGADNVGGPWRAKGRGYVGEAVALAFQSAIAVGGARSHDTSFEGPLDSVWGGFYQREVFERIGLFDEELVRNQDDELNYRLTKAGGTIWQSPDIRYAFICRNRLGSLFSQYFQYGYWKVRVIQKHKLPASPRHLVPGIFVGGLVSLGMLSMFLPVARILLIAVLVAYGALVAGASIWVAAAGRAWSRIAILPMVFGTFHVAYGLGFLKGVWDFVIRAKHRDGPITDGALSR